MTHDQNEKHKHKEKEEIAATAGMEPSNSSKPLDESGNGVQESGSGEAEAEIKEESVTIPLKEYATQMKEIDDLKSKINDFSDGWKRERADFTNYRSRILRDQDITRQDITAQVVKKYLAINDDIELALKNGPTNEESVNWIKGIQLIAQKLQNILDS